MCLGVPFVSLITLPGPCCAYRQRSSGPELTQCEVYTRLIVLGRTPAQIALGQGVTEHQVRQRLALANLLPQIRDLFHEGELETEDLQGFMR
jgi:ParB family chromosome partitioning protein